MTKLTFQKKGAGISCLTLLIAILIQPQSAGAHVKWFSEFSFADKPLTLSEILTPAFYALLALAIVVSVTLTMMEEKITRISWIKKIDDWFSSKEEHGMFVMRLGAGITLMWCWQGGKFLAPDLDNSSEALAWLQFIVAFLLVFNKTVKLAGVGILILFVIAVFQYGFFHMLDYLLYIGVGWFFIAKEAKSPKLRISALPMVHATLGFCLIWLGIEKLIYPSWSMILLDQHPVLALGIEHSFFVTAASMIEIGLGFLIMVCLQERLLALTITLVFVLTTLVFGREEVVGHTLIHTVLIVFLFCGAGEARPPLHWISSMKLRIPATAIAFVVLLATLMIPYVFGSSILYEGSNKMPADMHMRTVEVSPENPPRLSLAMHKDPVVGWNIELITDNFKFAPSSAGLDPAEGEGHAHLMIDGKKVARLYNQWHHLPNLPAGKHEIEVTLNANNHAQLVVEGRPIRATAEVEVLAK